MKVENINLSAENKDLWNIFWWEWLKLGNEVFSFWKTLIFVVVEGYLLCMLVKFFDRCISLWLSCNRLGEKKTTHGKNSLRINRSISEATRQAKQKNQCEQLFFQVWKFSNQKIDSTGNKKLDYQFFLEQFDDHLGVDYRQRKKVSNGKFVEQLCYWKVHQSIHCTFICDIKKIGDSAFFFSK